MALRDQALKKIGDITATVWLGGYWNGTTIQWDDHSTAEYNNIVKKTSNSGYLVLRLSDGKWDIAESGSFPIACMGQDQGTPCDDEWLYSSKLKSCYKLIGDFNGFTWETARNDCMSLGSDLASIHSAKEHRVVVGLADTYVQLMANGVMLTKAATWIGGRRTGPNRTDFAWSDGSPFDFTNWAGGQPDNYGGDQNYVQIITTVVPGHFAPTDVWLNRWDDTAHWLGYNAICKKVAKY